MAISSSNRYVRAKLGRPTPRNPAAATTALILNRRLASAIWSPVPTSTTRTTDGTSCTLSLLCSQSNEKHRSLHRENKDHLLQSLSDCVRTRTRKAWSRNTETKPNFYLLDSWWWFRAQMSALQQATAFLGATNRDATTIPPVLIRRNTSTLNDTFTGDRRFTSSFVSADTQRRRILREPATANGPTVPPRQYFRHCKLRTRWQLPHSSA